MLQIGFANLGIVDWRQVAEAYAKDFTTRGGQILVNHKVNDIEIGSKDKSDVHNNSPRINIMVDDKEPITVKHLVTCTGIYSDRVSAMTGGNSLPKMIPFRGEYLLLKKEKSHIVNGNIYPVPDPKFPFLGVHFTPRMNGDVWVGPNAVVGFSREGYSYSDIDLADLCEIFTFKGMIKIMLKHGLFGLSEMYKSLVLGAQLKELQKYIPELTIHDIERGPSGVRAQAVDSDGTLVEDFVFDENRENGILHVRNAPSPGATSSLAIAGLIVDKAEYLFDLDNPKNP